MDEVAERYPTGDVYIIRDSLNVHRCVRWNEFNARHGGRFHFVYTPIHASWVNQIERWFSIPSRRALKHASFASAEESSRCVLGFVTGKGEKTGFRGQWQGLLTLMMTDFPWTLAPIESLAPRWRCATARCADV